MIHLDSRRQGWAGWTFEQSASIKATLFQVIVSGYGDSIFVLPL
jgi:ketosteroid isomerase-like protein